MAKNYGDKLRSASNKFFTPTEELSSSKVKTNNAKTVKRGPGRPKKDLVRDNSAQRGLPEDYTRHSFIVRMDLLNKLQDYAYTERITIKEALEEALEGHLEDKEVMGRKK